MYAILAVAAVAFFTVPFVNATALGGSTVSCGPGPDGLCITDIGHTHFTQSLDCYLLGRWAGPGQGIGMYYFEGEPGLGCVPVVT